MKYKCRIEIKGYYDVEVEADDDFSAADNAVKAWDNVECEGFTETWMGEINLTREDKSTTTMCVNI